MGILHALTLLSVLSASPQHYATLAAAPPGPSSHQVRSLRITVLSTMLADMTGVGEWGFAALVETDGRRLLFDTGARPETVLDNARQLGIDLSGVTDLVLSHHHGDHTGGLITLRRTLSTQNPHALARAHVGDGIFLSRPGPDGKENNPMIARRAEYQAAGGKFVVYRRPREIVPGVWLTGPVPRPHPERNWPHSARLQMPDGVVEDSIPEDASLVIDTPEGLVVISGCGHAGTINTVEFARKAVREAPVYALLGGLHLFRSSVEDMEWTAERLKGFGLAHLLAAHCTGIEALFRIRQRAGLSRKTAVVGAVGSSFSLKDGIDPLELAR
ncbi:MAG TPA: MBL fold metallo-hydrolase [Gemmatimonadales bacterium]|jgi:7,8-dihydropterin-6-yl-methyl-4-(beta-D-ribofuranosyl)aminobenzene 5'-phosphate synthase